MTHPYVGRAGASCQQERAGRAVLGAGGGRERLLADFPLGHLLLGAVCAPCTGTGLKSQQEMGKETTKGFFHPTSPKAG